LGGPLALTATIDGVVLEQGVQLGQRVEASAMIYRIAKTLAALAGNSGPARFASGAEGRHVVKLAGSDVSGQG
jgi:cobalt-zinc-cadmium efflux system membrane fusion protein